MSGCIRRIESYEVAIPLPQPLQLGATLIRQREYAIVHVIDDLGNVGTAIGLSRNAPVSETVLRSVAPHFEGGSFDAYQQLYDQAVNANVFLGTNGIFWRALSLVDCAVHDLLGRRVDLPVGELLGGTMRPVPCILVGGYPLPDETPHSLCDGIRILFDTGPSGIKIGSAGNPLKDTDRLRLCREVMTDTTPLMIDCYWQFQSAELLCRHAGQWKEFGMGWVEDPVRFDDYQSLASLAACLPFPIAIGDEQSGLLHFERLIDHGHAGIIRLDATTCGGITAFRLIAAAIGRRNIPIACHIFPEIHSQLAAVAAGVQWVEMFPIDGGLDSIHMLLRSRSKIDSGSYLPPTFPGLGYEWDEEALLRYRVTK